MSMEGQLQEHLEKMQRTKAEREKLECANGEITKNVSLNPTIRCFSYSFRNNILIIFQCLHHFVVI